MSSSFWLLLTIIAVVMLAWAEPGVMPYCLAVAGLYAGSIGLKWARKQWVSTVLSWTGLVVMLAALLSGHS